MVGDGWLCLQTSAPGWAAPARQGLTWKQWRAPAPLIAYRLFAVGMVLLNRVHLCILPPLLLVAWLRDGVVGGASSSSISAPSLCDLGPVLT